MKLKDLKYKQQAILKTRQKFDRASVAETIVERHNLLLQYYLLMQKITGLADRDLNTITLEDMQRSMVLFLELDLLDAQIKASLEKHDG